MTADHPCDDCKKYHDYCTNRPKVGRAIHYCNGCPVGSTGDLPKRPPEGPSGGKKPAPSTPKGGKKPATPTSKDGKKSATPTSKDGKKKKAAGSDANEGQALSPSNETNGADTTPSNAKLASGAGDDAGAGPDGGGWTDGYVGAAKGVDDDRLDSKLDLASEKDGEGKKVEEQSEIA